MTESAKKALLYRMVMDKHICLFGLKSLHLLQSEGYAVEDRWLTSRSETDDFKTKHNVKTTPQTFIQDVRIGGYDDLRKHFGKSVPDSETLTYKPVIAVFAMAALMAFAANYAFTGSIISVRSIEWFIAFSMCLLAMLKLRDLEGFSNMFLGYDLLAQRYVPYAYVYPFAEGLASILMIAGSLLIVAIPVAFVIGMIGAISVYKAVYIEQRELKCACVGGDSNVPLGFISLTENLMMVAMALWMMLKP